MSSTPDTFFKGCRFLDEKLAKAEIPVIEVSSFDCLERRSV